MPSRFQAKYRVAVIGHTGRGDYGHAIDTVWLKMPGAQIVAAADANAEGLASAVSRLKAPQGYADYRKMLDAEKPDFVSICPRWLDQHREMVLAAAERGIHVFMEKPLCRTLAEADEMVAACKKNKVKLALAHQTRYSPKLRVVKEMIEGGAIGDVLELRGRGKEDARGGGEDLWVLGSHIMNLVRYFAGQPTWCYATVLASGKPVTKADVVEGNEGIGPLAGDTISAMYGLDGGATAYFGSKRNAAGGRFGLVILGSKGAFEVLTGYLPQVHYLDDPSWSPGRSGKAWTPVSSAGVGQSEPLSDGSAEAGNVTACKDLIAAVEQDREPECSIYEGRATIEMISAVFESHRAGGSVPMPLKNRENPLAML
jgi:predicted dehydrogenase